MYLRKFGLKLNEKPLVMNNPTIRQPFVFLPLAIALVALAMVLVHFAIFGIVEEADEGTAAHIFQLLIVAQVPFIAFLGLRWLALAPRQTLFFIVLQCCSGSYFGGVFLNIVKQVERHILPLLLIVG